MAFDQVTNAICERCHIPDTLKHEGKSYKTWTQGFLAIGGDFFQRYREDPVAEQYMGPDSPVE